MPLYMCFGVTLQAPIPLPLVSCTADLPADVVVTVLPPAEQQYAQPFLSFSEDCGFTEIVMRPPGVGTFTLSRGRDISFEPDSSGSASSLLELFLTGSILSLLLYQRGLLVLHGSVVKIQKTTVAFVGHSGAGKSSAVAACCRQGHALLADDITAIDFSTGVPFVQSGFPRLKVHERTAEALGLPIGPLAPVHPDMDDEFSLPLEGQFSPDSEPLGAVYLLGKGENMELERLSSGTALVELLQHAQPSRHGHCGGAHQFEQLAALVRQVPVFRLQRPRNFGLLLQLPQVIGNHLTGQGIS